MAVTTFNFFSTDEIIADATLNNIMGNGTLTKKGKIAKYYQIGPWASGKKFGIYQMSFLVDPSFNKDRRTVHCSIVKLRIANINGYTGLIPVSESVANINVDYTDWDDVRDVVIKTLMDLHPKTAASVNASEIADRVVA